MNNNYSNYSFDQINTRKYDSKCQEILNKAPNDEVRKKTFQILQDGRLETDDYDFTVNISIQMKDNPEREGKRRLYWANLLTLDENIFEAIAKKGSTFVHGTNSKALPNILKDGMLSEAEIKKQGLEVQTGEANSNRPHITRDFISFTYDVDLAMDYSMFRPETAKHEETYSTLIGISPIELKQVRTSPIDSDYPEIGIIKKLPVEYIKFIGVPECKVEEVQALASKFDANQVQIIPLEKIYEAASIISDFPTRSSEDLIIKPEEFTMQDIGNLTTNRKTSNIQKIRAFVEKIFKGKDNIKTDKDNSYFEK